MSKALKTAIEIKKKYDELNLQLSQLSPSQYFEIASNDGQRFILEWVMGQHG